MGLDRRATARRRRKPVVERSPPHRRGSAGGPGVVHVTEALPDDFNPVATQRAIGAEEGELLDLGLGDQQPVEGVAVVRRKAFYAIRMAGGYRQQVDTGSF